VRKVTFGVANSLDNFIAGADGALDWLRWTKDVSAITAAYWKTIDTVVMGRKTYEASGRNGRGYPGVEDYVFSRTLKSGSHPHVRIVGVDAVAFMKKLKRRTG
jgi:dihydrofolate reductase